MKKRKRLVVYIGFFLAAAALFAFPYGEKAIYNFTKAKAIKAAAYVLPYVWHIDESDQDARYLQVNTREAPVLPNELGALYQIWSNDFFYGGEAYSREGNIIGYYYWVPLHLPEDPLRALVVFSSYDYYFDDPEIFQESRPARSFKGVLWLNAKYRMDAAKFHDTLYPYAVYDFGNDGGPDYYFDIRYCLYEQVDGQYPAEVQEEYDAWLKPEPTPLPPPAPLPNTGDFLCRLRRFIGK